MKTSGYLTPVRIVFWVVMLSMISAIAFWVDSVIRPRFPHLNTDRAGCVIQQRNVQQAVRAYAAINSLKPGDPIDWTKIIGPGNFIEKVPSCPVHGPGAYSYTTTIPPIGTLVAPCKDPAHKPSGTEDW